MSSSNSTSFSCSAIFGEVNPDSSPAFCGEDQPVGVVEGSETSATNEVAVTKDIPPYMEYARWLRSKYTMADESFLRHNYDIPASVCLHFLEID